MMDTHIVGALSLSPVGSALVTIFPSVKVLRSLGRDYEKSTAFAST
jgi:hypothetical protein